MITGEILKLIEENTLGLVATVTPDGAPSVSPKGTQVVLDETHIAFGNIRSPQTVRNIKANPLVELNFIDVFARKAARLSGSAVYHERCSSAFDEVISQFGKWGDFVGRMRGVVVVEVTSAQL
ncbi:MAG: pyridoxamine 5'-phosphate oxidase family protein [Hyphomicrobiales bacterium]